MPRVKFDLNILGNLSFVLFHHFDLIILDKRRVVADMKQNRLWYQELFAMIGDYISCPPQFFFCAKLWNIFFRYPFLSMSEGAPGPRKIIFIGTVTSPHILKKRYRKAPRSNEAHTICAWLLHINLPRSSFLFYYVLLKTLNKHTMITETFCTNSLCTPTVRTDRTGHPNIHEQIATENQRINFHPFHADHENKFNSEIASDNQKTIPDGCPRLFMSKCIGSKWIEAKRTRPY